ncbi:hypothetical protein A2476_05585 [candidate division CPR3 bacterium RIFOXYC2_FULL_35_7]|nr:MAG: hypothetical protein A2476_05585 [candidate division CPR3 bacterium RIFOXYC2_FULL_35_7]
MNIFILFILILLNGMFSMAEIAIISARRTKLQHRAKDGDRSAQLVLDMAKSPNQFLSSIQISITLIGILTGVLGGAEITDSLAVSLARISFLTPYSSTIALWIVVIIITYFTIVLGELVPKRLALNFPDQIALFVALPLHFIIRIFSPIATFLSSSTDLILQIFQLKKDQNQLISEDEIKILISEGTKTGVFNPTEKDIVERTFKVGDKKVKGLMTPRSEIIWIDINNSEKIIRDKIIKNPLAYYPVCRGSIDKVKGVIRAEDVLTGYLVNEKIELEKILHEPLLVSENMKALDVIDLYKKSGIHTALVLDEFGSVEGLISLTDILEAIVGSVPSIDELEEQEVVRRKDGSFLVDGLLSIDEFKEQLHIKHIPGEYSGDFNTIGGYVFNKIMNKQNEIPKTGNRYEDESVSLEIVDMDGNRIDKLLVIKK